MTDDIREIIDTVNVLLGWHMAMSKQDRETHAGFVRALSAVRFTLLRSSDTPKRRQSSKPAKQRRRYSAETMQKMRDHGRQMGLARAAAVRAKRTETPA